MRAQAAAAEANRGAESRAGFDARERHEKMRRPKTRELR